MLGHDDGHGQRGKPDVLEFGRDRQASRWRASRVPLALLVIVTALVVIVQAAWHHPRPRPTTPQQPATAPPPPPVRVISVGHRLLGVRGGWELFARGPDDLLRIQLSQGRVIRTYVPALETGSRAVAFLIAAHKALIRPADLVPGYVVPDGGQARPLAGLLARSGPLLPGPAGSRAAWILVIAPPALPMLSQVTLTGHRSGARILFPPTDSLLPATAVADGRGNALVLTETFTAYDVGPGGSRKVPGTVVAVGQASWLTVICRPSPGGCHYQVIDSADGARRPLPGMVRSSPFSSNWPPAGVIAPDGTVAAVPEAGQGGSTTVHLVSLSTGSSTDLGVRTDGTGYQTMAWSPDSRWLFVATASGKLVAVDARSGRARSLGVKLPAIDQVAIRP